MQQPTPFETAIALITARTEGLEDSTESIVEDALTNADDSATYAAQLMATLVAISAELAERAAELSSLSTGDVIRGLRRRD